MNMIISNSSSVPIYEQIKNSIIKQIMNDELASDEMIPSIRTLARDMKISVMTVKKAYDELERDGYIVIRQGKGTFVSPKNTELICDNVRKEIEEYLSKIIEKSKKYDIKKEEIIDIFNFMYGSDDK